MNYSIKSSRPLGNAEFFYWQIDPVYCTNFSVYARVQGKLSYEQIQISLKDLQSEYPPLRSHVLVMDEVCLCEVTSPPPISFTIIHSNEEAALDQIISEAQHRFKLEKEVPARCLLVSVSEDECLLVLILSHVIADGRASIELFQRFMSLMGGQKVQPKEESSVPYESRLSGFLEKVGGARQVRKAFLRDQMKVSAGTPSYDFPGYFDNLFEIQNMGVLQSRFNGDQVKKLLEACRRHKTTLQGFLGAALLMAVHETLNLNSDIELALNTPCDFRNDLDPAPTSSKLFLAISSLKYQQQISASTPLWDMAQSYSKALKKSYAEGTAHLSYDLMYDFALKRSVNRESSNELLNYMGAQLFAGTMTNWGKFSEINPMEGFKINELNFIVPPVPFSLATLGIITCYNQTFIHLSFNKNRLSPDVAKQILKIFHSKTLLALETTASPTAKI